MSDLGPVLYSIYVCSVNAFGQALETLKADNKVVSECFVLSSLRRR